MVKGQIFVLIDIVSNVLYRWAAVLVIFSLDPLFTDAHKQWFGYVLASAASFSAHAGLPLVGLGEPPPDVIAKLATPVGVIDYFMRESARLRHSDNLR